MCVSLVRSRSGEDVEVMRQRGTKCRRLLSLRSHAVSLRRAHGVNACLSPVVAGVVACLCMFLPAPRQPLALRGRSRFLRPPTTRPSSRMRGSFSLLLAVAALTLRLCHNAEPATGQPLSFSTVTPGSCPSGQTCTQGQCYTGGSGTWTVTVSCACMCNFDPFPLSGATPTSCAECAARCTATTSCPYPAGSSCSSSGELSSTSPSPTGMSCGAGPFHQLQ